MKITKRQLKRIIKEEKAKILAETHPHGDFKQNITFEWSRSGLTMHMMLDGRPVMDFGRQKDVSDLIKQLQDLLAGPMRTSP